MKTLRFILGDQLTRDVSALADIDPANDIVLMAEVDEETGYVPHHRQKIAFILSAMRHFAEGLRGEGILVDYRALDAVDCHASFGAALAAAVSRHGPDRVVMTEPGEWRVAQMMEDWRETLDVPLEVLPDDRFLCSRDDFAAWAKGRRSLRMEYFYREMRRRTGFLMQGDVPLGGRWNLDAENRKPLPENLVPPAPARKSPDALTRQVIALVAARFPANFGDLDGFGWAVTREDALEALARFIDERLPLFGDYQDAMREGEDFLYHAVLSPYLNCGLLTARECCEAACFALEKGTAPLNAVEGFVRQIIGWREYVRGLYWHAMPAYAQGNALGASRKLPWFYWSGETEMRCLAAAISNTRRHAYAHHIQRLMVTGNFALLAGIAPAEIEAWYLAVYADAYEWVELPNTHGMVMFADGGLLASKPYAASGAYINRMSDHCRGCRYDPAAKQGEKACPFNYLYWNFLIEHAGRLRGNPRLAMPYRTLERMSEARIAGIKSDASTFLALLETAPREGSAETEKRKS